MHFGHLIKYICKIQTSAFWEVGWSAGVPGVSYHDLFVVRELQAEVVALHEIEVVAHGIEQHLPGGPLLWTESTGVRKASAVCGQAHKPHRSQFPHQRGSQGARRTCYHPPCDILGATSVSV